MNEVWTIASLKEYLEGQICSVDRRHSELAGERNRAVDAALTAAKEKAQAHNELLSAMKDQQSLFLTKEQAAAQFRAVTAAIAALAALMTIVAAIISGIMLWGQA